MSRTKYGIKAKAVYSLPEVRTIIEDQCQKKKLEAPRLDKGHLNRKAREYGLRPYWNNGIEGHGYREKYLGESVILFIDMFMLDLKGEREKTKQVKTRKKTTAPKQELLPLERLADEYIPIEPVPVCEPTSKEDLERALDEAAEEIKKAFISFMTALMEAFNN